MKKIDTRIAPVRDGEVEFAIVVEVRCDEKHRCRSRERKNRCCGSERSVAVAEQNRHVFGHEVRHRHVGLAIAIEIADDDGLRRRASGRKIDGFFRKREDLRKAWRGQEKRESEKSNCKYLAKMVVHEQTAGSYAIIGRMTSREK